MVKVARKRCHLCAYLSLLLMIALASGCAEKVPEPLDANSVVLAFGDSLTKGYGVVEKHSYPTVLAQRLNLKVVNAGVSGETTPQGLRRLPGALRRTQPDLVILMHGGNDILRNHRPATTKANLSAMIEMVLDSGAQVLLVAVPEKSLFSSGAPLYTELAEEYDVLFESGVVARLLKSPSKKSDLIHFNQAGYAALADALADRLREADLVP